MHIRDDFQGGAPISQVPASWFNSVAKFINSIIGGENVTFNKHDDGTESVIEVSGSGTMSSDDPQDVSDTAACGTSSEAARGDHVHAIPVASTGGIEFDSTDGLKVKVDSTGGIEGGTDGLAVKVDSDGGLQSTTDGIAAKVASDGGIEIDATDGLKIKAVSDGGLETTSDGLKLKLLKTATSEQKTIVGPLNTTTLSGYSDAWTDGTYTNTSGTALSGKFGVKIPVFTGCAVDTTGTLFSLRYRYLIFDRNGRLYSVTAEQKQFKIDIS